jgi:hypothetical protein
MHFLGMVGFCVRFVKSFCLICERLHVLKRKGAKFMWTPLQQASF